MSEAGLESRPNSKPESKIKVMPPTWPKVPTEWPTVILFFVVVMGATVSTVVGLKSPSWTWPFFMLVNAICVYGAFTIMHEASHRNISRRFSRSEYFMGVLCTLMYHGSYEHFVILHLRHHAKVNIPGEDPDLHVKGRWGFFHLLGFSMTVLSYFRFLLKSKMYQRAGALKMWGPYIFVSVAYVVGLIYGVIPEMIVFWLIPSLLGVTMTALVFDYLPHAPHTDTGKYTHARTFPGKGTDWLFCMHSYHIVHHLWPSIPWYRYRETYYQRRDDLQAAGNIEIPVKLRH